MAQQQWYMAIGGHQVGPVSQDDVVTNLRNGTIDGNTLVFTAGMSNWTPLKDVPQLAAYLNGGRGAPNVAAPPPPIVPGRRAHEIDFRILGSEMQFVEVELDPGESAVAEAGSMMYMTPGIAHGDGVRRRQPAAAVGVMDALLGAGKRLITGESLFMTVFTNAGSGKQQVSFAAPYPGKILAMDLKQLGGQLICQKDSFLCAAKGVSIGIAFQRKLGVGLFGGEGFIMQRLEGDGLCFVHAGGTVHPGRSAGRPDAARRHRLSRGAAAVGQLRHPVRRQGQDGAVRRRRAVLRHADRPGPGLAAVAAVQPHGRSHLQGRAGGARRPHGRGLDPWRPRRPARRRQLMAVDVPRAARHVREPRAPADRLEHRLADLPGSRWSARSGPRCAIGRWSRTSALLIAIGLLGTISCCVSSCCACRTASSDWRCRSG